VIVLAVRWYLRFGLSYRDVEELLAERGIEVDHVTVHRWVRRFGPLLVDAARFGRHRVGDRWFVDETYVKVAGRWVYLYRAVDQFGQVIDVYASARRDSEAARRFFHRARKATGVVPVEVITDRAPAYLRVLDQVAPAAWHHVERYANNRVEADHAQLKRWLRPQDHGRAAGARRRSRVRARPAPRPLRDRRRPTPQSSTRHRVRPPSDGTLSASVGRDARFAYATIGQRKGPAPAALPLVGDAANGWTLTIDQSSPVFAFLKKYRTGTVHMTISYMSSS
jgi:transposase-like protein